MTDPSLSLAIPDEFVEVVVQRVTQAVLANLPAGDGYLDVGGAAAFLACSKNRIYALTSSKRLPYYKDGSRLLFDRSELREYVRKGGAVRT